MLIAEGGSTKLDIVIVGNDGELRMKFPGINPYYQTADEMYDLLKDTELAKFSGRDDVKEVFYYGAGVANQAKRDVIISLFKRLLKSERVCAESDLLAAARGSLGHNSGVIAILGTGANSGLYDGEYVVRNVSSLGFMLGDEGSGAYLGKRLVADVLKGLLSSKMTDAFFDMFKTSQEEIMDRVYHGDFPNRYLASFVPFLASNREDAQIGKLIRDAFDEFFKRNIEPYQIQGDKTIMFVGGVAEEFSEMLAEVAARYGFKMLGVCKSPLQGLIEYHKA